MKNRLKNEQKRMKKFSNIDSVMTKILKTMRKAIINMNKDQMYEMGVMDRNNPSAILHYAPSTIKNKKSRAKFPRTDHITLKWSGDFHKSLKIKYEDDGFLIFSEDEKWKAYLEPQYVFENALGLTDESLSLLREWVRDELIKRFKYAI